MLVMGAKSSSMSNQFKISKYFLLLVLLLMFLSTGTSRLYCDGDTTIHEDGDTLNHLNISIIPRSGYYYPSGSKFSLILPKSSTIEDVNSNSRIPDIDSEITSNLNRKLEFTTRSEIQSTGVYEVSFKYSVENGAVVYGNRSVLNQYLPTSSCLRASNVEVDYPVNWEYDTSLAENVDVRENEIILNSYNQSGRSEIFFTITGNTSKLTSYQSSNLNVSFPGIYQQKVKKQTDEVQDLLDDVEEEMGIKTPDQFDVKYLPIESGRIGEEVAGQYYGGNIELSATQLGKIEEQSLETFLHEIVHGYSDKILTQSPDWWWEEGTANHVSHQVMEENGYDVTSFEPSEFIVNESIESCYFNKEFISDWSPVDEPDIVSIEIPCQKSSLEAGGERISLLTNKDRVGYRYSELIVQQMFNNTEADVSSVYNLMQRRNITFSNQRELMNNQINFFASRVTGKNMTQFLRRKGVETGTWSRKHRLLAESEEEVSEIDSNYSFFKPKGLSSSIDNEKELLYEGKFSKVNTRGLLDKIEGVKKEIGEFRHLYNEIHSNIESLEDQQDPKLFQTYMNDFEEAEELANQKKWDLAERRLEALNTSAYNKSVRVKEYKEELNNTKEKMQHNSFLPTIVNLGTESQLSESRRLYTEGNFKGATKNLDEALYKLKIAPALNAGLYILLLGVLGVLTSKVLRWNKKQ